jgi:REP element-mobilizing transposase RayT
MKRAPQLKLFANEPSAYGGDLQTTRSGRARARPLDTKRTMHLVLRSTKAKGDWSFKKPLNEKAIEVIFLRFGAKFGVKILSLANVGNHLHAQIKISNRHVFAGFLRAVSGAIAQVVTGRTRWHKIKARLKFWDRRPFTRVVKGQRAFLNLRDYIRLNELEGRGYSREEARLIIYNDRDGGP